MANDEAGPVEARLDTSRSSVESFATREASFAERMARTGDALERAGFQAGQIVLNGLAPDASGREPSLLEHGLAEAADAMGLRLVEGETLLDEGVEATGFIGTPDRFFLLCRLGYGPQLTHALLAGGAVFPIVYGSADQHTITLSDLLIDKAFGPFALRSAREGAHMLLHDVQVDICRPGSLEALPLGMVGEAVLTSAFDDSQDALQTRTGMLTAFEQVPHRYRAPGLQGWMGLVQPSITCGEAVVTARDIASIVAGADEVLDARLVSGDDAMPGMVLQVETEAGTWIEDVLATSLRDITGLSASIERVAPGSFANTGRFFTVAA
ncbi:MAG: hypothetical protein AAF590_03870 [Pseudomonadota bacterium]